MKRIIGHEPAGRASTLTLIVVMLALVVAWMIPATAQTAPEKRVAIDLIAEPEAIVPGEPFRVALRQRIDPGWHTYWRNPGDAGGATEIDWALPDGFSASPIRWPIPSAIPYGDLMSFGYEGEVLLLIEITPPSKLTSAAYTLTANTDWLVCSDICIPESGSTSLSLPATGAGGDAGWSLDSPLIEQAGRSLPRSVTWSAQAEIGSDAIVLSVAGSGLDAEKIAGARFFPFAEGQIVNAAAQPLEWTADGPVLTLARETEFGDPIERMDGVLVLEQRIGARTTRQGYAIAPVLNAAVPSGAIADPVSRDVSVAEIGLLQALLFAILGGLILNLMPCVFPVLSLKALKIARHGQGPASERRAQGMAYGAGVLVSFAILAAVLIVLRASGAALGWGFQFQSPGFVLAMATLFFALGLSLSGVFTFGGSLMGIGNDLADRPGRSGSFFTGVLATIVATPCTAPFMGVALGYAFTRTPIESVLVLLAVGIGFALPLVLVSYFSLLARLLPKPGAWMDLFKQIMAFPLYASSAWLVWVLSIQMGSNGVLAAMVALTGVGFAAWLFGRGPRAGVIRTAAAGVAAIAAIGLSVQIAMESEAASAGTSAGIVRSADAKWEPYAPARLASLREKGRPVFIDFTAAWCITCKVNEQVAFSSSSFYEALEAKDVAYMKGDWTNRDPEITAILERFGRAGVPLYLLYPADDPDGEPQVLPQILTPGIVLDHLAALPDPSIRVGQGG